MLVPEKLTPLQRRSLDKSVQAALNSSAASLKQMLGGEISIGITRVPLNHQGVSVHLCMSGALEGGVYIDIPEAMALDVLKALMPEQTLSLLDEAARSMLMEFGNILVSVFVAYFDQFRGLRTVPTPPQLSLTPFDIPPFADRLIAEFSWSKSRERAEILIGFKRSALEIMLAG